MPRLASGFGTVRDLAAFLAGLGVIAHEVLFSESADPTLVAAGVALMGVPFAFSGESRSRGRHSRP